MATKKWVKTRTYLSRVDVSDHVVHSVAVKIDDVNLALPVLLHVVGEHSVEDSGSRGKDVLVAPELPTLTRHHTVRELALRKTKLNLNDIIFDILTDSKMLEMSRESRETGSVARPVFPFTGLAIMTIRFQGEFRPVLPLTGLFHMAIKFQVKFLLLTRGFLTWLCRW